MAAAKGCLDRKESPSGASCGQIKTHSIQVAFSGLFIEGNMRLDKRGAAAGAVFEAVYLYSYPDPATGGEPITCGIGHTAAAGGIRPRMGQAFTLAQVFEIYRQDMEKYSDRVNRAIKRTLGQDEHNCLALFDLNTGAIFHGTVDDKINRGDDHAAMNTLEAYVNAAGKRMAGLVTRRREERAIFEHGIYPTRGIVLREHPSRKARTLNPENIPWGDPDPPPVIDLKPDDFVIPPVPEQKPGFSLWELLTLIVRWFREPVVKPA